MPESEDICVREFREVDTASTFQLMHHTIEVCYTDVYPPRAIAKFKNYHSLEAIHKRAEEGHLLLLLQQGKLMATGTLLDGEICGVFVDPAVQGQGHGKRIMQGLEAHALQIGLPQIRLSITLPSRAFYEGLGYVVVEDDVFDVGEGQKLCFWNAKKSLQDDES